MSNAPDPPDPSDAEPPSRPTRTSPDEALPDILERIVHKRQVQVEDGDIVITRERLPRLNPYATISLPWRYRVRVYPEPGGHTFSSFQHAASEAEDLATGRKARVLYIETDQPAVLADYRR